ncbi:MAG: hypothetical protein AWU57_886 [Marinobacter sp. T13-3]|nr:MAG: hypothetical protein AWU57_886 [Marinobacter sp. T13-3]
MGHWHVDVVAVAFPFAPLIFKAADHRVEVGGITVDRDVQHIAAIVENFLDALAVMHVGVQDRDARKPALHVLGGNRCVIQVTEPAGGILAGMMPGRTAYCVGAAFTGHQGVGCSQCGLCGPVSRLPRTLANRATAIGLVAGGFGQDALQGVGRAHPDVGYDFISPVTHFRPAPLGGLQEAQIPQIMHLGDRCRALVCRLQHRNAHAPQPFEHQLRTRRHLLRLTHLAASEIGLGNVQILVRMKKCFHAGPPWVAMSAGLNELMDYSSIGSVLARSKIRY